jgi:hypothetical protein
MYGQHGRSCGTVRLLDSLTLDAAAGGVPVSVADEARRAAEQRFHAAGRPSPARVTAYFWGVIRRRALRGGAPIMRERLLVTSFVEELTVAGHAPSRVYEELLLAYGDSVDPTLLDAFRPGSPAHAA